MKMKKQYIFGDCIPYSKRVYRELEKRGYNPVMVEGYTIVNIEKNQISNMSLNMLMSLCYFSPEKIEKINKDINNKQFIFEHMWVELNGKIIDITKNQFDKYGGVKKYYISEKYRLRKQKLVPIY